MNALAQQDAANDADGEGSDGDTDDSDDSDDTFEFVDADTLMEMARAAVSDSTRQCVQDLTTQGFDLRHYNSRASGNDVIALLSALGVDEYNIYGISYGTRLALSIMRDHPHSGIRSVVLDSTFPPQIHGFEQLPVEAEEVVLQVFSACALDPACDAAYPNLKERFIDLLARLHEEPVMTSFGEPFTADDLVEFVKMVSQQSELGAYIPLVIAQLEMGDTTAVEAIATGGDDERTVAEEEPATAATPVSEPTAEPTPAPGADEAATFIGIIHDALQGASLADKAEVLYLLALLDQGPHTTEALRVFTYRAFANDEDARAQLLAVIDALTPQGLEQVFVTVEQIDGLLQISTFGLSAEVFNSVECNEEVPFERIEQAVANWHSLQIPELAEQEMVQLAQQFASCELWPSGHAGSIENLPVVSDIPTLIFSGGYDFQTPPTWNKDAFLRLPNATFVNFPATNHAVIAYHGECASDIADAFMDTPFAVPDISCTEDLKPVWILPDGSSTADV
jgi:pimeloyl-ACP methyl ester carboxylesterase